MSLEFQRLASVRARQRSRRRRWLLVATALGIADALMLASWLALSTLPGSQRPGPDQGASALSRAASRGTDARGETRGHVSTVEPDKGIIRVSSGFLGLMSVALRVTTETVIVVGDKEGGFGDIREGDPVVAAYEVRSGALEAKRIELRPRPRAPER